MGRKGKIKRRVLSLIAGVSAMSSGKVVNGLIAMDRIYRELGDKNTGRQSVKRALSALSHEGKTREIANRDGTVTIELTKNGKIACANYNLDHLSIKKIKKWDGKWWMVAYDIPNKQKLARDAFRFHLKRMGFYEYQKSLFIYPYDPREEIDFISSFYGVDKYVKMALVETIDDVEELASFFNL